MTKVRSNKKKKSVSWASFMVIREHIVRQEDISNSWYQRHEIVALNRENREICWLTDEGRLILHNECSTNDNDRFCTRGLETMKDAKLRRDRIGRQKTAINLVLEEQDYQREEQGTNAITCSSSIEISEIYQFISKSAQKEAQERGLEDQRIAKLVQEQKESKREVSNKSQMKNTKPSSNRSTSIHAGQTFQSLIRSRNFVPKSA